MSAALAAGTTAAQASGNVSHPAQADSHVVEYDEYFTTERLRVDFILAGDRDSQQAFLADLKKECEWAGSHGSLIDPFRYGEYMLGMGRGEAGLFERFLRTVSRMEDNSPGGGGVKSLHAERMDAVSQEALTHHPL